MTEEKMAVNIPVDSSGVFDSLMAPIDYEGFDPYKAVVAYKMNGTGKYRVIMPAKISMAWFRAVFPEYSIKVERIATRDPECAFMAYIVDKEGNYIGIPGAGSCKRGDEDLVHINYVQSALTNAIRNCLRNNGFREPADVKFVEGVTPIYDDGTEDDSNENGVVVTAKIQPPPPMVKAPVKSDSLEDILQELQQPNPKAKPRTKSKDSSTGQIMLEPLAAEPVKTETPKTASEPKLESATVSKPVSEAPVEPAPVPAKPVASASAPESLGTVDSEKTPEPATEILTLEQAEAFPLPGKYEGMTFSDGLAKYGRAFVRFYMGPKFNGTKVQQAAKVIAGANGF